MLRNVLNILGLIFCLRPGPIFFPRPALILLFHDAGAILNKYNEIMRMISRSSILESPESLRVSFCIHTPDSIAIPALGVGGCSLQTHFSDSGWSKTHPNAPPEHPQGLPKAPEAGKGHLSSPPSPPKASHIYISQLGTFGVQGDTRTFTAINMFKMTVILHPLDVATLPAWRPF